MYLKMADRLWKSLAAGLCGSIAHSILMFLKSWMNWLPEFHPYQDLQEGLSTLIGSSVHPAIPWALSFFNGAVVLGLFYGHTYRWLPGRSGLAKGFVFGLLGWIAMGVIFFPALGRGFFALKAGLGLSPALFSLAMLLTYSIIMGMAYALINPGTPTNKPG
ncbi:MAG: hypothetical protein HY852_08070 [Bradyrhizobium sp.]|uniref:DUF6789 family protein n=1 Tax=Bradyrhizobium sp. TaxID=376 RepID=UPI0025BC256A|nr:DUF6789 family protein [Bradyrhizobium sp.]MBI5261757.1 hypothetical protein [Bradyrhizobium sp.]